MEAIKLENTKERNEPIECPIIEMNNVRMAMKERLKKGLEEYEAFTRMHTYDGTISNTKCVRKL